MRPSRSHPRWVLLLLAALALAACGSPATPATSPPVTTTSTGPPPVTEPIVGEARLRTILLRASDLPPSGFSAETSAASRGNVTKVQVCGQPVVTTQGAIATAEVAFSRLDQLEVSELLMSFASTADADRVVAQLAGLPGRCPVDGLVVTKPLRPPAVGENEAGAQITGAAYVNQVAVVRSGVIDAVVLIGGLPPDTVGMWDPVVKAVGTSLAVGTGG